MESIRATASSSPSELTPLLAALADGTRLKIFDRLLGGGASVSEIATSLPVSRPAVSQHLAVLKSAGLVVQTRSGRRMYYSAAADGLDRLGGGISAWRARLPPEPANAARLPADDAQLEIDDIEDVSRQMHERYPRLAPDAIALVTRLQLIGRLSQTLLASHCRRHRINPAEFRLLGTLRRLGPSYEATPSELARISLIAVPGLVRRIERLARLGLLRRRANPADARSSLVRLSARGRTITDAIVEAHLPGTYASLFETTRIERERVNRLLQALIDHQRALQARSVPFDPT